MKNREFKVKWYRKAERNNRKGVKDFCNGSYRQSLAEYKQAKQSAKFLDTFFQYPSHDGNS